MPFTFNFEDNQLHAFLKEVAFPASRKQLEDQASASDLSSSVIATVQSLPDRLYESPDDVTRTLHHQRAA
ncbi:MAG: DUF2795 domain-containing protein [Phycisphaerae bacterium]|nr:DUF2795 domain-containing protein [Phycisphaerae bacterium]